MYAYYYKFERIPYRNLVKMRLIEIIILLLSIYLLSILWILFDSIAIAPFESSFSVVLIDSQIFSQAVDFGYNMMWISIAVNFIIALCYRKFQSLTKLNVLKQDLKDVEILKRIKDSVELERVGALRNQQVMIISIFLSILSNIVLLNFFPRRFLLFPSYVNTPDQSFISNYFEYQSFFILMIVLCLFSSITIITIILSTIRQIRDINRVLYKHEDSKKVDLDKPIKRMSMQQKHQIRMLAFEEEKKLYEIKAREKMIKMVEKEQEYNLTVKTQLEKDQKILERAKEIIISNMEQLKRGIIPNLIPLENLLDGTGFPEGFEEKDAKIKDHSEIGDSDQSRSTEIIKKKEDRKSKKDKQKAMKDKFDFR